MIIESPANTRTGPLDPASPGPETTVHFCVAKCDLDVFNGKRIAQQVLDNMLEDAEGYRTHHMELVVDGPEAEIEKCFVERNYQAQKDAAETRYKNEILRIQQERDAVDLSKPSLEPNFVFYTGTNDLIGCDGVWAFDAPLGFGELPYEDEIAIAMKQRPQ